MITRLLIANRGEIARRIMRSCRDAGISTVAVFADADADAPHSREADLAVRLPGSAPGDTYLRIDLLIAAARETGADAVHPGYGFLSENAAFAQAVIDAGLTWVGPTPAAIDAMGSKIAAKKLMAAAGVPVLPDLDPDTITEADLPVLIKASAGGGGRGMRIVRDLASLPGAVEAARGEAEAAFGDAAVFCEPYVETGRHLEVQVLADAHGRVWTLGERECSIQRRHQKIIEESPSPLAGPEMRARLAAAAHAAAAAIGYRGAGTVEFLAANDGSFHFLEMNTRLQVEHPVTEAITGLDLVAWQLRIAEGAELPAEPPAPAGHAIEARLYAEDPAEGWRPQSGTLTGFSVPGVVGEFAPCRGLRLDSGVDSTSTVSVHYDPMLAKVIAWAPSRPEAARALAGALAAARIHGVVTNRDLLVRVLRHESFLRGEIDTGFLDRHPLTEPLAGPDLRRLAAVAAALAASAADRAAAPELGGLPSGWRNLPSGWQRRAYRCAGEEITVGYRWVRGRVTVEDQPGLYAHTATPDRVELMRGTTRHTFTITTTGRVTHVDHPHGSVTLDPVDRFPAASVDLAAGSLTAPMPGSVVRIAVAVGDPVTAGQPLLWLEAMKMRYEITAPAAGTVAALPVALGAQVEVGTVLAVVETTPEETR